MDQNFSERLKSKSVKNSIVNNIARDFNLTPILAEAYFTQIKDYFLQHANLNLSSGQVHYLAIDDREPARLKFIPRDTRDFSRESIAENRFHRINGKSLKSILLDRFLNHYGYDKGFVTASAIIDDLLLLIEHYYRYSDNSFIKQGQMVWHAVPVDEMPAKGKSIAQTSLKPVVLDIISQSDIDDMKTPMHHREIRLKKVERWTQQAFDQGALLSQLDLAVLFGINEFTAGQYVREYYSLYNRTLPTRGNIQQIGSGQSHKKQIITDYLNGFLVPTICQRTNHSKDAVERYIRDFEAVRLLSSKFDDLNTISLITRLSINVVSQYIDLIPADS